jgi:hypothetical protein
MHRSFIITIILLLRWAHIWIPALISTLSVLRIAKLVKQIEQLVNTTLHWDKATLVPVPLSSVVKIAIGLAKIVDILEVNNPGGRDILHQTGTSNTTHLDPAPVRVFAEHRVH